MFGQFLHQNDFSRTALLGLLGIKDKSQLKEMLKLTIRWRLQVAFSFPEFFIDISTNYTELGVMQLAFDG